MTTLSFTLNVIIKVLKVKHLKDGSNNFLSYFELQIKFSLKTCPLRYYGLISALKLLWNARKINFTMTDSEYETFSETLIKSQRTSPPVYQKPISKKSTLSSQSHRKGLKTAIQKKQNVLNGAMPIN